MNIDLSNRLRMIKIQLHELEDEIDKTGKANALMHDAFCSISILLTGIYAEVLNKELNPQMQKGTCLE